MKKYNKKEDKKTNKTAFIKVRCTAEEKERIRSRATNAGRKYSDYCREMLLSGSVIAVPPIGDNEREALVYVPASYTPGVPANIVYLTHGWWGTADGLAEGVAPVVDQLTSAGSIAPMIVVFATYYPDRSFATEDYEDDYALNRFFATTEIDTLIKTVESHYTTFARGDTSDESLRASRRHRAFGGFSMGATTTWDVFALRPQYFYGYIPMAGESWIGREEDADSAQIAQLVTAGAERAHYGQDPGDLGVDVDPLGAGAGGLPADVDDVGALGDELAGVGDGRLGVDPAAAVGEGVGGDVEDAHEERPVAGHEPRQGGRGGGGKIRHGVRLTVGPPLREDRNIFSPPHTESRDTIRQGQGAPLRPKLHRRHGAGSMMKFWSK